MKISKLLFGTFLLLILSCTTENNEVVEVVEVVEVIEVVEGEKTTIIERLSNGTKRVCVTCSNGYKFCCDSPKSPNVNCVTKTGKCETSSL